MTPSPRTRARLLALALAFGPLAAPLLAPTVALAQPAPAQPLTPDLALALDQLTAGFEGGGMAELEKGLRFGVGEEEGGPKAPPLLLLRGAVYFLDLAEPNGRTTLTKALATLMTDIAMRPDAPRDVEVGTLMSRAGQALYDAKDFKGAARTYAHSVTIFTPLSDAQSPDLAAARYTAGLAWNKAGDPKKAEPYLKAAFDVLVAQRPEQDGLLAPVAKTYGDVLKANGKAAEAAKVAAAAA